MTERRPQSRMLPVAVAGLVGVLLGALIVVVGVLAGQSSPACCCVCSGGLPATTPLFIEPAPLLPEAYAPPWVPPYHDAVPVPLPGSLMLVGVGALAMVLRA